MKYFSESIKRLASEAMRAAAKDHSEELEMQIYGNGGLLDQLVRLEKLLPRLLPPSTDQPSLYKRFTDAYFSFCKGRSIIPRYGAAQGKGMKEIISYLRNYTDDDTDDQTLDIWQYILCHWEELRPFIRNQVEVLQINKNLVEIINQMKYGTDKQKSREKSADNFAASLAAKLAGNDRGGDQQDING